MITCHIPVPPDHVPPPPIPQNSLMRSDTPSPAAVAFRKLATGIADLYERKNKDYGDSFGRTYAQFGIISALTRISDKYNRICELGMSGEQKVKDEAIRDTLLDLASYSLMTVIELDKRKEQGAPFDE